MEGGKMSDTSKTEFRKCYNCNQPSLGVCPECQIPLCFECGKEHPALESQYTVCTGYDAHISPTRTAAVAVPMAGWTWDQTLTAMKSRRDMDRKL